MKVEELGGHWVELAQVPDKHQTVRAYAPGVLGWAQDNIHRPHEAEYWLAAPSVTLPKHVPCPGTIVEAQAACDAAAAEYLERKKDTAIPPACDWTAKTPAELVDLLQRGGLLAPVLFAQDLDVDISAGECQYHQVSVEVWRGYEVCENGGIVSGPILRFKRLSGEKKAEDEGVPGDERIRQIIREELRLAALRPTVETLPNGVRCYRVVV